MKYRIKVVTSKAGIVRYYPQVRLLFGWRCIDWDGKANCWLDAVVNDYSGSDIDSARKRIKLHQLRKDGIKSVNYVNISNGEGG
jgi:hypothetical protein